MFPKTESVNTIVKYARRFAEKGFVCNPLGNVALREHEEAIGEDVVYTKRRGISLDHMSPDDVAVVGLDTDQLYHGVRPSLGHQLSRRLLQSRHDINAVVHLHIDECIGYFSVMHSVGFEYISADAAIIIGSSVHVFPPEVNVELDTTKLIEIDSRCNAIVMANHGVTVLGRTIEEAYYRTCTLVAEIRRIILARFTSILTQQTLPLVSQAELHHLYSLAEAIL